MPFYFLYVMIFISFLWGTSVYAADKKSRTVQGNIILSNEQVNLFPKLFADPYEIQMGFSKSLNSDRFIGRIGQEMPLFHFGPSNRKIHFSLGGHTWSLLTRRGNKFPLLAVDYLITGIFDFQLGDYSARFKVSHISAHQGDFFSTQNNPKTARTYSQEFLSGLLARSYKWGNLYGGGHWLYNTIPKVKSIYLQVGSTFHLRKAFKNKYLPYISIDLQYQGSREYSLNQNYQIGYRLYQKGSREFRLASSYYSGFSIFGQDFDFREQFYSVGFFIDY